MNTDQPFIVLLFKTNRLGIFFKNSITMLLDFTRSRHFFIICDLCEIDCQMLQFCILLKLTKNKINRIKSMLNL